MLKKNIEKEQSKKRRKTFVGIRPARFNSKKREKSKDTYEEYNDEE